MDHESDHADHPARHASLLTALEGLLAIEATDVKLALTQTATIVVAALRAEKADVFLYDTSTDTLVAVGTSDTPLGRKQVALGLNRLPLSNGGKTVRVFQRGEAFLTGHLDQEEEVPGIPGALGVRSAITVPLNVAGTRRGVVQVDTAQPEQFTPEDLHFLEAIARWVGLVLHRAELAERLTREAAARAKSVVAEELITILAHDLRAPLTALMGRSRLLELRAERDGQRAYHTDAGLITRAAKRLDRMIGDVLDTARLEHGLFTLKPLVVDLVTVVRETAATLQTPEHAIVVRTPDELAVEADPDRIRQVLENLLSNAAKHSPDGVNIILEVSTDTRADGHWAMVTVRDFGQGVAPEVLPRIFERFIGGWGTTGLGLGLYLAHGIAQAHGGSLTVESAPGDGATFRLALPLPAASA